MMSNIRRDFIRNSSLSGLAIFSTGLVASIVPENAFAGSLESDKKLSSIKDINIK